MSENRSEFKLKNGPDDGISAVRFGPSSSQFLLASSWDSHVRLYDVVSNSLRLKYSHGGRPVLSCAFQDPIHVWSGGKFVIFHVLQKNARYIISNIDFTRCFGKLTMKL